ncbi:hypothetical protein [uncultured Methylobacterium sp.]|uniref:hypothetical protein n=1 Tax=uncultured Methylobacterium sp. TaxID=157278 RepID=UPI0035CA8ED7
MRTNEEQIGQGVDPWTQRFAWGNPATGRNLAGVLRRSPTKAPAMPQPSPKPLRSDPDAVPRLLVARRAGWIDPVAAIADVYAALGERADPALPLRRQLLVAQDSVSRVMVQASRSRQPSSPSVIANMDFLQRALDDLACLLD